MNYIWPLTYLMIHFADEAYDKLHCVCSLNCVFDGTDKVKSSSPSERVHKFKLFCSLVDVGKNVRDSLKKTCMEIVTNLNEIGSRPYDDVSRNLDCSFQYMKLTLTPSIFDYQSTNMYKYSPTFVFNDLTIHGKTVPISFLAHNVDIPRLIFKMFSLTKTKEDLAKEDDKMKLFFGCVKTGRTILNEITEDEWYKLRYSVATQDS